MQFDQLSFWCLCIFHWCFFWDQLKTYFEENWRLFSFFYWQHQAKGRVCSIWGYFQSYRTCKVYEIVTSLFGIHIFGMDAEPRCLSLGRTADFLKYVHICPGRCLDLLCKHKCKQMLQYRKLCPRIFDLARTNANPGMYTCKTIKSMEGAKVWLEVGLIGDLEIPVAPPSAIYDNFMTCPNDLIYFGPCSIRYESHAEIAFGSPYHEVS